MEQPKIYTQFDPPPSIGKDDFGPSMTRQEFADESDINNILNQYATHGVVPETRDGALFADFTDPAYTDFQRAQNMVVEANYLFEALPAKVRERFNNDPASLILFVQDDANRKEAELLGLLKPPEPTPEPVKPEPAK